MDKIKLFQKKPVIFTVHGFGKKLSHEFDPLANYLKKKHYQVIQFDMYDLKDTEDVDYKKWIQKAEVKLQEQLRKKKEIIVIGFSMGGVIASYLASIYPVKTLILCAPAFQYLDFSKISAQGVKLIKNISKGKESHSMSSSQTKAFTEIVSHYKTSIEHVTCPVYFLHGSDDEIIPVESSKNAYKKVSGYKRMFVIEGGFHRFLYDGRMEQSAFVLIEQMILRNI
ncbi:MAG: alpha/beta hydrolase [Floccifex sp.]